MESIINLTILLTVTMAVVLLLRLFRQPPIISYILAGILLGPSALSITGGIAGLEVFSHLGIAFLLFIVGVNLDIRSLKKVGLISSVTGIGQVIFTSAVGFTIAKAFGMSTLAALYVAVALTFSSTIIIVKLLTDRKELDSLHGKVAMGFLVVQDIIAVLALMLISALAGAQTAVATTVVLTLIKGAIIGTAAVGVSLYLLPYLLHYVGKSQEVLFLFSITWCFAFAGLFEYLNFSMEIGALIAGLMLASTPYSYEIASKIKPLRDFFITIFFIILGSQLQLASLQGYIGLAVVLSAFVLIGNPLIVMTLMGWGGFSKRTSFMAGLTVAQISEFSLILVTLGASVGHVSNEILNLVTVIGLITILGSTYMVLYADGLYARIKHYLPHYRRGVHHSEHKQDHHLASYDVILFGYSNAGVSITDHFTKNDTELLIIDFNPEVVLELQEAGRNAILGDANDAELYEELRFADAEIIVSTIPDHAIGALIIQQVKKRNPDALIIVTADQPEDALSLYDHGADYVIIPHMVGGEHATIMLDLFSDDLEGFLDKKARHVEKLHKRH